LATLDNACIEHYWIADQDAWQNPIRAIYDLFDLNLNSCVDALMQSPEKGDNKAQENAAAALLWLLGFAPHHFLKQTTGPDVIALSREGHVLVVECTLGHLQSKENKPQKLLDRTTDVEAALARAGIQGRLCLPVMVTSKRRDEIIHDVEDCERKGIFVFTRDDLEELRAATIVLPNPDLRVKQIKDRIDERLARMEAEKKRLAEAVDAISDLRKSGDVRRH
jgi:hypothetical protein